MHQSMLFSLQVPFFGFKLSLQKMDAEHMATKTIFKGIFSI
jgi:hypothetical protein